jgi:hypothetical protein
MASGTFGVDANGLSFIRPFEGGSWSTSDDPANNRTLVSVSYSVRKTGTQTTFGTGTFGITINGDRSAVTKSISVPVNTTVLVHSHSVWVGHAANGTGSASITIDGTTNSSWTSTTITPTSPLVIGLTDYDRGPSWIDSSVDGTATRGTYYSDGVSANAASSYGIVSNRLPYGLSLNTSNGAITGTPTTVESQSFTIRAYGSNEGSIDAPLSINVRPALPVFSDSTIASSANVGIAYSDGVSASETASYSVVAAPNTLPPGLTLNTSTGAITGTPTTPGTYSFKIRATNVTGSTDTATLTITAISAARVWNGTAFVSGLANVWNGTAFVSGIIKVWDGTTWKNTN